MNVNVSEGTTEKRFKKDIKILTNFIYVTEVDFLSIFHFLWGIYLYWCFKPFALTLQRDYCRTNELYKYLNCCYNESVNISAVVLKYLF